LIPQEKKARAYGPRRKDASSRRDCSGASGLFTRVLRLCRPGALLNFIDSLELFGLGVSWGRLWRSGGGALRLLSTTML